MFSFLGCQIDVPPQQMSAIVRTESAAHQYAIGVVGHYMNRQPASLDEAIKLVKTLRDGQHNYSVGLAQVNQVNFAAYGINDGNMFDICPNLRAGSQILKSCYDRYDDWGKAYSCYYSGNAVTGYKHGYVQKVQSNFSKPILTSIAAISPSSVPIVIASRGGQPKTTKPTKPSLHSRRLHSPLSTITME